MAEMDETNRRLMIENGSLRVENQMLKSQVGFMEKLLMKQTCGSTTYTEAEEQANTVRVRGGKNSLFAGGPGAIALLCVMLIMTYLPENNTGNLTIKQRVLAEISTGFHLFSPQGISGALLSTFRLLTMMALFYTLFILFASLYKKRPSVSENLLDELLKKNT